MLKYLDRTGFYYLFIYLFTFLLTSLLTYFKLHVYLPYVCL